MTTPDLLEKLHWIENQLSVSREFYITSPMQLEGILSDTQVAVRKLINALHEEDKQQIEEWHHE